MLRRCIPSLIITLGLILAIPVANAAAKSPPSRVADPVRISIPRLHLDAPVQGRGTTAKGYMVPPTSPWKVAWYLHGVRPGERGNAVMYGHINSRTSSTGVFTNLHRLRVGDRLIVTDQKKVKRTFRVTAMKYYPTAQVPLREITGESSATHLNLYTCAGRWNRWTRDYSLRLVVYTEMVSSQTIFKK